MNIYEKLAAIQSELYVPKNQRNNFGGFNYRSCEDILQKATPLCKKYNTVLILSDELVNMGDRYYVKAKAELIDLEPSASQAFIPTIEVTAYAREELEKKGMDQSQVTGASSSYARKYALNGLFCIDDAQDSDATNTGDKPKAPVKAPAQPKPQPTRAPDPGSDKCEVCGKPINEKVRSYSMSKFGKALCMDCQKNVHR